MFDLPVRRWEFHLAYATADILTDRDTDPLDTSSRFDPVAIAPIVLCELHLVINDELVNGGNYVEIALPGNVVRLQYRHRFQDPPPGQPGKPVSRPQADVPA